MAMFPEQKWPEDVKNNLSSFDSKIKGPDESGSFLIIGNKL